MTKEQLFKTGNYLLIAVIVALAAWTISEVLNYKNIRKDYSNIAYVTVSGTGESFAIPDIANITMTAREVGKTTAEAQKMVQDKFAPAKAALLELGIQEKDIKTTGYNIYPKYTYPTVPPCIYRNCPAVDTNPKLDGYEASQSVEVKVRNTDNTGKVLEILAKNNITEIYGPSFTVDNIEEVKAEAQQKAIYDAKEKAKKLAKDLGVDLVKVTNFDDGSSNGYYDDNGYFSKAAYSEGMGGDAESYITPDVPAGESKIVSNVSITYEIED